MARQAPGRCPICGEKLYITGLSCKNCHTKIEGDFEPCRFCALNTEQKAFLEVFIKSRGNIKEVERELGISYPTVRSRLDNVLEAMGYRVDDAATREDTSSRRKEILDALARGEISSDEAVKLIRAIS